MTCGTPRRGPHPGRGPYRTHHRRARPDPDSSRPLAAVPACHGNHSRPRRRGRPLRLGVATAGVQTTHRGSPGTPTTRNSKPLNASPAPPRCCSCAPPLPDCSPAKTAPDRPCTAPRSTRPPTSSPSSSDSRPARPSCAVASRLHPRPGPARRRPRHPHPPPRPRRRHGMPHRRALQPRLTGAAQCRSRDAYCQGEQ